MFTSVNGFGIIAYFFMIENNFIVYTYPTFCIHSYVLVHVACFLLLAIEPSGAKIAGLCFSIFYFLRIYAQPWDCWVLK